MIEVTHDPLNLPHKALLSVRNARHAEALLGAFVDARLDRGYRLRIVPDYNTDTMELGARGSMQLNMALRYLKDCGQYVEQLNWANNKLLKNIPVKKYR